MSSPKVLDRTCIRVLILQKSATELLRDGETEQGQTCQVDKRRYWQRLLREHRQAHSPTVKAIPWTGRPSRRLRRKIWKGKSCFEDGRRNGLRGFLSRWAERNDKWINSVNNACSTASA